jgi:hypothetical protein
MRRRPALRSEQKKADDEEHCELRNGDRFHPSVLPSFIRVVLRACTNRAPR